MRFAKCATRPGANRVLPRTTRRPRRLAKGTKGVDTDIVYRADEMAKAIGEERVILIAEGEKDVDNLRRLGIAATCNAHGADPTKRQKLRNGGGPQRAILRRRHCRAQR